MVRRSIALILSTSLIHCIFFLQPAFATDYHGYGFPKDSIARYSCLNEETLITKEGDVRSDRHSKVEYVLDIDGREYDAISWGYLKVKASFKSMKLSLSTSKGLIEADSDIPFNKALFDRQPGQNFLISLPGESFSFEIIGSKLDNLTGTEAITKRMITRSFPPSSDKIDKVPEDLKNILSDAWVRDHLVILFLPVKDISTKYTFTRILTFDGINYTYEIEYDAFIAPKDMISVKLSGTVKFAGPSDVPITANIEGEISFDPKVGMVTQSELKAQFKAFKISFAVNHEMKLLELVKVDKCGPESYERPLRPRIKVLERRVIVTKENFQPVYSSEQCEETIFSLLDGDVVRVLSVSKDGKVLRIASAHGREGYIPEGCARLRTK